VAIPEPTKKEKDLRLALHQVHLQMKGLRQLKEILSSQLADIVVPTENETTYNGKVLTSKGEKR